MGLPEVPYRVAPEEINPEQRVANNQKGWELSMTPGLFYERGQVSPSRRRISRLFGDADARALKRINLPAQPTDCSSRMSWASLDWAGKNSRESPPKTTPENPPPPELPRIPPKLLDENCDCPAMYASGCHSPRAGRAQGRTPNTVTPSRTMRDPHPKVAEP